MKLSIIFLALFASTASAEEFTSSELMWGKTTDLAECQSHPNAVWAVSQYGTRCIRYFPSSGVQDAEVTVISFHGDPVDFGVAKFINGSEELQLKSAEKYAKIAHLPWIKIGRPGAYGSSGNHLQDRRLPVEYYTLKEAVDQIRVKYNIKQIILSGQSGGAAAAVAVATLGQTDVSCVIGASGPYNWRVWMSLNESVFSREGRKNVYDPSQHVDGIKGRPRFILVGDPADEKVAFGIQERFGDQLRQAGFDATVIPVKASGSSHHQAEPVTLRAAGMCDLPAEEITAKLQKLYPL